VQTLEGIVNLNLAFQNDPGVFLT